VGQQDNLEKAALILALILVGGAIVQHFADPPWTKFTSPEGSFTVLMPRKPKAETRSTALNGMKLETHSFSASSRTDVFFSVAYIDAPTSLAAPAAEKALDDQVQNLIHGDESRLLSTEKLTLNGYPGRWYKAIVEGG
jgi:hypothetical protein